MTKDIQGTSSFASFSARECRSTVRLGRWVWTQSRSKVPRLGSLLPHECVDSQGTLCCGRTRVYPFPEVWPELHEDRLVLNPGLQAKTLFEDLQHRFPGRFPDGQLRTLQRKIKAWRATDGPPKEVFFDQIHTPGPPRHLQACISLNDLQVTLAGQSFDHLVYHFVLTYSNWEPARSLYPKVSRASSQGLPNALWELDR